LLALNPDVNLINRKIMFIICYFENILQTPGIMKNMLFPSFSIPFYTFSTEIFILILIIQLFQKLSFFNTQYRHFDFTQLEVFYYKLRWELKHD